MEVFEGPRGSRGQRGGRKKETCRPAKGYKRRSDENVENAWLQIDRKPKT